MKGERMTLRQAQNQARTQAKRTGKPWYVLDLRGLDEPAGDYAYANEFDLATFYSGLDRRIVSEYTGAAAEGGVA